MRTWRHTVISQVKPGEWISIYDDPLRSECCLLLEFDGEVGYDGFLYCRVLRLGLPGTEDSLRLHALFPNTEVYVVGGYRDLPSRGWVDLPTTPEEWERWEGYGKGAY